MNCTLCNSVLYKKIDESYYECQKCFGLLKDSKYYPNKNQELTVYNRHNNDVEDIRYQNFTAPIWKYVLRHFQPGDCGLDFGSGTGPVISKVLEENGYSIKQYDPYFSKNPELLAQQYHYIVSCEVIEHFFNPKKEFTMLHAMLQPKGQLVCMSLLYQESIDFKDWHYRRDPTHVFIYQPKTIAFIAKTFGFRLIKLTERLIVWEKE